MAVGDIWQGKLLWVYEGQNCETVLHYVQTGAGNDADTATALVDFLDATLAVNAVAAMVDSCFTNFQTAQKIFPGPPTVALVAGSAHGGTLDEIGMPSSVSGNVKKKTPIAGPKYRGRSYFMGMPASGIDQATGLWNVTQQGRLFDIGTAMLQAVGVDDFGPHLWPTIFHRGDNTNTRFTAFSVDPVPRNQRRRQIGRGI